MQKEVWQKMNRNSKADFDDILKSVSKVMYMTMPDSWTYDEKCAHAQNALDALLNCWSKSKNGNYTRAAEYYRYWYGKTGALTGCHALSLHIFTSRTSIQFAIKCCTCTI